MRRLSRIWIVLGLAVLFARLACADNFTLMDGQTFSGELVSPDDKGAMIRIGDGKYAEVTLPDGKTTQRIPWSRFSQDDLKRAAQDKRVAPHVEPWIDLPPVVKEKERAFTVKEVTRLDHPQAGSFFGAFVSSGIGMMILFLLYGANLYAAYEVSTVRAYPWPLVCGVSAVAPLIGPILFVCLPTRIKTHEEEEAELLAAQAALEQAAADHAGAVPTEAAEAESALALAKRAEEEKSAHPPTQTFARGQFTFNRRFFETKFSNYFGIVRRESEKDLVLVFKTARGQYTAERITRIAANEMHLQVREGPASKEVMVPFIEIQEVLLKHKDVPH